MWLFDREKVVLTEFQVNSIYLILTSEQRMKAQLYFCGREGGGGGGLGGGGGCFCFA